MLHELIHLSQNEKCYFKLQSSLMFERNDNLFCKTFYIISNQKNIMKNLLNKMSGKHFPQLKAQATSKNNG